MKIRCLLILCLLLSSQVNAQTAALVRAYVQPEETVYAGQLFTLYIEAKTETFLLSSPNFPQVEIENGIAIQPSRLGSSFSERIDGTVYSGTRQRFLVSSHKVGRIEFPAYSLSFDVAGSGPSREPETINLLTAPITINTVLPPGLNSIENVAVTTSLSIREEISPSLAELKVGDAFTRSIFLEANGSMGFMLPTVDFLEIDGTAIYPSQPRFDDDGSRGRSIGRRVDSATYVLQQDGDFMLPAIEVQWFNLTTGSIQALEIPSQEFEVAVNPQQASVIVASATMDERSQALLLAVDVLNWLAERWEAILVVITLMLSARYFWQRYRITLANFISERWRLLVSSRKFSFAVLLIACSFKSSVTYKKALLVWMLEKGNSDFAGTSAFRQLQSSYSKDHGEAPSRWLLVLDLLKFELKAARVGIAPAQHGLNP